MEQAGGEHGAARPDRMAVRDGTTLDIDHVLGQAELTLDSDRDRSKGLVDLDPLDVADLARSSAWRTAGTGPIPNMAGSTAPTP